MGPGVGARGKRRQRIGGGYREALNLGGGHSDSAFITTVRRSQTATAWTGGGSRIKAFLWQCQRIWQTQREIVTRTHVLTARLWWVNKKTCSNTRDTPLKAKQEHWWRHSLSTAPRYPKEKCFVLRFPSFARLSFCWVVTTKMVYSTGGIMLKGSNPKYWQKNLSHCHFTHYRFQSGHGSTPGLHGENPDTHRLGHGKTLRLQ